MLLPTTEKSPDHLPFDAASPDQAASLMLAGQAAAIDAVAQAAGRIELGAEAMAHAVRVGQSLIYCAAGSSGLMALADACELPGTFGLSAGSVRVHMAGGVPVDGHMPGGTEDDVDAAKRIAADVSQDDVVIVISASGTTPYAVSIARAVREAGATIIGIANNPKAPVLDLADIGICLETPPEIIAGSTRLGAGTAQKAAMNLMSSRMAVKLGHVFQGQMVNVVADNSKLMGRATGIVSRIAHVSGDAAKVALASTQGQVKQAILVATGATVQAAEILIERHGGLIGPCLDDIYSNQDLRV